TRVALRFGGWVVGLVVPAPPPPRRLPRPPSLSPPPPLRRDETLPRGDAARKAGARQGALGLRAARGFARVPGAAAAEGGGRRRRRRARPRRPRAGNGHARIRASRRRRQRREPPKVYNPKAAGSRHAAAHPPPPPPRRLAEKARTDTPRESPSEEEGEREWERASTGPLTTLVRLAPPPPDPHTPEGYACSTPTPILTAGRRRGKERRGRAAANLQSLSRSRAWTIRGWSARALHARDRLGGTVPEEASGHRLLETVGRRRRSRRGRGGSRKRHGRAEEESRRRLRRRSGARPARPTGAPRQSGRRAPRRRARSAGEAAVSPGRRRPVVAATGQMARPRRPGVLRDVPRGGPPRPAAGRGQRGGRQRGAPDVVAARGRVRVFWPRHGRALRRLRRRTLSKERQSGEGGGQAFVFRQKGARVNGFRVEADETVTFLSEDDVLTAVRQHETKRGNKTLDGSVDPTADLSFNLTLTDDQREAKSKVALPYLKAQGQAARRFSRRESVGVQGAGGGTIFYAPDAADDFDEDDPDDDLDI
ncbi:MAG: hypothetical protein BJ554DRAFT_7234, partial [Olpidium bornovanus]